MQELGATIQTQFSGLDKALADRFPVVNPPLTNEKLEAARQVVKSIKDDIRAALGVKVGKALSRMQETELERFLPIEADHSGIALLARALPLPNDFNSRLVTADRRGIGLHYEDISATTRWRAGGEPFFNDFVFILRGDSRLSCDSRYRTDDGKWKQKFGDLLTGGVDFAECRCAPSIQSMEKHFIDLLWRASPQLALDLLAAVSDWHDLRKADSSVWAECFQSYQMTAVSLWERHDQGGIVAAVKQAAFRPESLVRTHGVRQAVIHAAGIDGFWAYLDEIFLPIIRDWETDKAAIYIAGESGSIRRSIEHYRPATDPAQSWDESSLRQEGRNHIRSRLQFLAALKPDIFADSTMSISFGGVVVLELGESLRLHRPYDLVLDGGSDQNLNEAAAVIELLETAPALSLFCHYPADSFAWYYEHADWGEVEKPDEYSLDMLRIRRDIDQAWGHLCELDMSIFIKASSPTCFHRYLKYFYQPLLGNPTQYLKVSEAVLPLASQEQFPGLASVCRGDGELAGIEVDSARLQNLERELAAVGIYVEKILMIFVQISKNGDAEVLAHMRGMVDAFERKWQEAKQIATAPGRALFMSKEWDALYELADITIGDNSERSLKTMQQTLELCERLLDLIVEIAPAYKDYVHYGPIRMTLGTSRNQYENKAVPRVVEDYIKKTGSLTDAGHGLWRRLAAVARDRQRYFELRGRRHILDLTASPRVIISELEQTTIESHKPMQAVDVKVWTYLAERELRKRWQEGEISDSDYNAQLAQLLVAAHDLLTGERNLVRWANAVAVFGFFLPMFLSYVWGTAGYTGARLGYVGTVMTAFQRADGALPDAMEAFARLSLEDAAGDDVVWKTYLEQLELVQRHFYTNLRNAAHRYGEQEAYGLGPQIAIALATIIGSFYFLHSPEASAVTGIYMFVLAEVRPLLAQLIEFYSGSFMERVFIGMRQKIERLAERRNQDAAQAVVAGNLRAKLEALKTNGNAGLRANTLLIAITYLSEIANFLISLTDNPSLVAATAALLGATRGRMTLEQRNLGHNPTPENLRQAAWVLLHRAQLEDEQAQLPPGPELFFDLDKRAIHLLSLTPHLRRELRLQAHRQRRIGVAEKELVNG